MRRPLWCQRKWKTEPAGEDDEITRMIICDRKELCVL